MALLDLPEADDLDFKREPHGNGESERRDVAADVCAMANHRGGWIVIGVAETDGGSARVAPLEASALDHEELRLRQTVASFAAPVPDYDVVRVPCEGGGVLVIVVPPSPGRPHAVTLQNGLRYPLRDGAGKRYLAESEIAALYRNRFAEAASQIDVLERRQEALSNVLPADRTWLTIALQPNRTGAVPFRRDVANELQSWIQQQLHDFPAYHGSTYYIVRGGFRSYRFRDHEPEPYAAFGELHTDGGGVLAFGWDYRGDRPNGSEAPVLVADEDVVSALINSLNLLVSWAVDRARASGDAAVVARLHPAEGGSELWQYRSVLHRRLGGAQSINEVTPACDTVVDLVAARTGPPDLLLACRALSEDLLSSFEFIEPQQIDPEGRIRLPYFDRSRHGGIRRWAQHRGATTLPDE